MVRTRATSSATTSDYPSRVEAPIAPPPSNHSADNPSRTNLPPLSVLHHPNPVNRPAYEDLVMSWILHSVSPEIMSSIMYFDTASEMWTVLNNRFNKGNSPCIFELNETLTYLNQRDDSISPYFTKLTATWDKINKLRPRIPSTCAAVAQHLDHQNHDQVLQFLKGLNDSYKVVRDQILLLDPCPPLNKVF
uniref:Retrotransposon gag domain-containing protein n=1 Tax=Cannabis sativa TaxID=3483 RepID=A0A803NL20_CANSA